MIKLFRIFLLASEIAYTILRMLLLLVAFRIARTIVIWAIPAFCWSKLSRKGSMSVTPTTKAIPVTPELPYLFRTISVTTANITNKTPKIAAVLSSSGFLFDLTSVSLFSFTSISCFFPFANLESPKDTRNIPIKGIDSWNATDGLNIKARNRILRYIIPVAIIMAETVCGPEYPCFSCRDRMIVVAVLLYSPPSIPVRKIPESGKTNFLRRCCKLRKNGLQTNKWCM